MCTMGNTALKKKENFLIFSFPLCDTSKPKTSVLSVVNGQREKKAFLKNDCQSNYTSYNACIFI